MSIFDNDRAHWRVRNADRLVKRYLWDLRRILDASAKEEVKAVSMVVVGRNDNYGGDFSDRLRATIDWNYSHFPQPELIYVEWNQIPDRESDTDWIADRYENCKCFIVPNEIHQQVTSSSNLPMMEYFAKNLGIRESSSDWIAMVNADVFLGLNAFSRMRLLSKKHMYGTHYTNIKWHGEPITEKHIHNKDIVLNRFSTDGKLGSVVGNFILTHRDNWMMSRGYDETLTDVRLGVDNNGKDQLLYLGVKPMVLGDHYHLDHGESAITNKGNSTHGNRGRLIGGKNIPYSNPDSWGFVDYPKKQVAEKVWRLEKI